MPKRKIPRKEKEVLERAKTFEYPTDRLGPGSLMTQQSHTNSSRLIMTNSQLSQNVNIENPDMPLVPTGFENALAKFSTMLDKAESNYKIVAKFIKNDYNYILIGFDEKNKRYHAWKRNEVEEHSEGFSTQYNNKFIDSLEIGDIVHKGDYIKKSDSFDKYMNYCYGRNLNTVYLVSTLVMEDGITLMNNADKKFNTFLTKTITIPLAENEILLNWYGDDEEYQPIPKIGEKCKYGYIGIVRRVDNAKAPYALKRKKLRSIERGDRKYYGEGKVIDINILYNKDKDNLIQSGSNKLINNLYEEQQKYYKKVYDYMINIIDTADDNGCTYTDEFTIICEDVHDYVDASAFFADVNDSIFGNMQIQITIMEKRPMYVGSKMVGRYGNKGVIANIIPPEESWHMEDGRPVECVVAGLGIIGRLNQGQMNEHSINELSSTAVAMMKKTEDLNTKGKIVYDLMKFLNSDEADEFKKYFKHLDKNDKDAFCKKIERDGIIIVQDPIDNADMTDIAKAYDYFPPNWQHIIFEDGKKSMKKVLCAKMFFIRLKQDPIEKYSVRSRGPVNPLTNLPAKSNQKKKSLAPFSDVAVRFGELELELLLGMVNHPAVIAAFMAQNSTSLNAKLITSEYNYLGDPEEDLDLSNVEITGKKNLESIDAYTNVLGTKIDIEYEKAKEGEYFTD